MIRRLEWMLLFGGLAVAYAALATGGTFRFEELERFPNHGMLARAFAHGRLWIEESPPVDVLPVNGRRYLYFGPVPAAARIPLALLGVELPTGVVVVLLGAAVAVVLLWLIRSVAPAEGPSAGGRWLHRLLVVVVSGNGLSLFMVAVPLLHHESIMWSVLLLLLAVAAVLRSWRDGPTVSGALLLGVPTALAVGSRFSCLPAALLLVGGFLATALRSRGERGRRPRLVGAAVIPLAVMLALLAAYNAARFGSPVDFGLDHQTSRYQQYIRDGHFWRFDHIPYNLWDYLGRPPELHETFPWLRATIVMHEVTARAAVPTEPYRLVHVTELAVSVVALLPICLAALPALALLGRRGDPSTRRTVALLVGVALLQLAVLSLTVAATARFMSEVVPPLMVVAAIGCRELANRWGGWGRRLVVVLVVLTLLVSQLLPLSAVLLYPQFLGWRSPLLGLVGAAGP